MRPWPTVRTDSIDRSVDVDRGGTYAHSSGRDQRVRQYVYLLVFGDAKGCHPAQCARTHYHDVLLARTAGAPLPGAARDGMHGRAGCICMHGHSDAAVRVWLYVA
jgi:hypothetical protein